MGASLVTGGRGFVGAWLAKALLERGETVVSFDRRRTTERPSAVGMLGIEADLIQVEGELRAYRHEGFWDCMDTYKDAVVLNDLWSAGRAPWRIWDAAPVDAS